MGVTSTFQVSNVSYTLSLTSPSRNLQRSPVQLVPRVVRVRATFEVRLPCRQASLLVWTSQIIIWFTVQPHHPPDEYLVEDTTCRPALPCQARDRHLGNGALPCLILVSALPSTNGTSIHAYQKSSNPKTRTETVRPPQILGVRPEWDYLSQELRAKASSTTAYLADESVGCGHEASADERLATR